MPPRVDDSRPVLLLVDGKVYAMDRREVLDMMQRYDAPPIENEAAK